MGLLDLASPAFSWVDANLAAMLPAPARVLVWGSIGAAMSMALYWLLSPQQQLARIAVGERELRLALRDGSAELADERGAAVGLLRLAITRIGLTLLPVLVAAVPVICLATWLQSHYGHDLPPPEQTAAVRVEPSALQGRWVVSDDGKPRVDVLNDQDVVVHSVPITSPAPFVHKRAWWNVLIGNPLGYLPDQGLVERIEIGLPEKRYSSIGPSWIRGWEAPFFAALLVVSVALKLLLGIR
jgi:hypothetical protein